MPRGGDHTHFGYETVPLADKQGRVDDVFRSVARRYDLMNDLMSGGLHRAWKDALVTAVNPPKSAREFVVLDLAGGTGDVAFRIAQAGGPGTRIVVCDINPDMLAVGQERAAERGLDGVVTFEQGNAEELAYPDRSFDCVTIAFGSATCRASSGRLRKPIACSSSAADSCVSNFLQSTCRVSTRFTSFIPFR